MFRINGIFSVLRTMQGVTQRSIAEAIGISHVSLSRFEYGMSTISKDTIKKAAQLINLNPEFIDTAKGSIFKAEDIIKMTVQDKQTLYIFLEILCTCNNQLDMIITIPNAFFTCNRKSNRLNNALLIKDEHGNIIHIRNKYRLENIYYDDLSATLKRIQKNKSITARIKKVDVYDEKYKIKINEYLLTRKELEFIFSDTYKNEIIPTREEIKLLLTLRNKKIDPANAVKLILESKSRMI